LDPAPGGVIILAREASSLIIESVIGKTMTVFGIGTLELVLILLLLILIFGPERIGEMGRWLGRSYRRLTGVTNEINEQVTQVRKAMNTAVDVPDLTKPLQEVSQEISSTRQEINTIGEEIATKASGLATAEPEEERKETQA
jgi:Sec-independent protein translocase protein TatA